ncbi:hypothetical protein ACIA5C_04995 [Actinoplanes sp. NPDC051343]|uniref:hypothetical protein n=1 Tax=Actinoplanes sp. NPDC051343 TaxID=3363906 RepID=UPI00379FDEA0
MLPDRRGAGPDAFSLSEVLRNELKDTGITVTALMPRVVLVLAGADGRCVAAIAGGHPGGVHEEDGISGVLTIEIGTMWACWPP